MHYPLFMTKMIMSLLLISTASVYAADDVEIVEEPEQLYDTAHLQALEHAWMEAQETRTPPATIDDAEVATEKIEEIDEEEEEGALCNIQELRWIREKAEINDPLYNHLLNSALMHEQENIENLDDMQFRKPKIVRLRFLNYAENTPDIIKWMKLCIRYGQLDAVFESEEELRALCPGFIEYVQQTCYERVITLHHLEKLYAHKKVRHHFDRMRTKINALPQKTQEEIDKLIAQRKGLTPNIDLFIKQEQRFFKALLKPSAHKRALAIVKHTRTKAWSDHAALIQDTVDPLDRAAQREYFVLQKTAMVVLFCKIRQIKEEEKQKAVAKAASVAQARFRESLSLVVTPEE